MEYPEAIGFPPPLLGERPQRLPVLAAGAGWLALDKPPGCLVDAHPWNQGAPCLVASLRTQVEAGKPELASLAIETPYATHYLDIEASGVALLATDKPMRAHLKELIGSSLVRFKFQFVARQAPDEETIRCKLPLGEDPDVPRAAVERKLGKKARTDFRLLRRCQGLSLWEATTDFPRPQQVRVHAVASGFQICGERLFGEVQGANVGELNPRLRGSAATRSAYYGLALRLVEIDLRETDLGIRIDAGTHKPWRALLRHF